MTLGAPDAFSLDDLRRDVRNACMKGPAPDEDVLLDPYAFISQPAIVRRIGAWIAGRLDDGVDRLVGVGASALGVALAAGLQVGLPVAFAGPEGLRGDLGPGDRIALVADITKTGASARAAHRASAIAGASTVQLFVVWDRGRGALEQLADLEVEAHVLIEDRPR